MIGVEGNQVLFYSQGSKYESCGFSHETLFVPISVFQYQGLTLVLEYMFYMKPHCGITPCQV